MGAVANLSPTTVEVEPGREVAVGIRVRNTGAIVDRFDVTVVGPLTGFATISPTFLSLFPGQEGEVRIAFRPPRAANPRAGTYPFGVRVVPAADPAGATVEEGRVTIQPFFDAMAEIAPQTSRGRREGRHEVSVENRANAPMTVDVSAADPDRLVSFTVDPARFVVGPGERNGGTIRARAGDTFLVGQRRNFPFVVDVRPAGRDAPIQLRGTLMQGPLLPAWLLPLAGLLLLAIVVVVVIPRLTGAGGPQTAASNSPSPTLTPSPEPTPSPTEPPVTDAPTDAPTPSPGPFQLVIEGDDVGLGAALTLRCPPQPTGAQCQRDALDTVRALVTSLGAQFTGRGIVSTENLNVANTLPVVMLRDIPFGWIAQENAVEGQTARVAIDLAPLVANPPGFAYAVVDSDLGPRRFVLPDALARQLLETIYEPNPVMVDPLPSRTFPTFLQPFVQPDLQWAFLFTPPPGPVPGG